MEQNQERINELLKHFSCDTPLEVSEATVNKVLLNSRYIFVDKGKNTVDITFLQKVQLSKTHMLFVRIVCRTVHINKFGEDFQNYKMMHIYYTFKNR